MKAAVRERYTTGDAIELRELETPIPGPGEVLVRVRASSVNPVNWYGITGTPLIARPMTGLRKPKDIRLGGDLAGVVEAVGPDVDGLAQGDEVFGYAPGAFAELVLASDVERKPERLTFEEAATIPIAALTALQGLRDKAGVREGHRVLINGASGGVGTFAIQIAKALGAEVTAVCSTRNVEQARALGADRVVDYTREDFTKLGERYDAIFDNVGNRSWRAYSRLLAPGGTLIPCGGPKGRAIGPLGHIVRMLLAGKVTRRKVVFFVASPNRADLATLRELVDSGRLRPVVEAVYDLEHLADALAVIGAGHARGKIAVSIP